mmetsp:Transcript_15076/g.26230  ORF Transcript_15076/g.26230 Transcript_15076/m.26230 type:complete len:438 (-) Transcript_15076:2672-3985(-)
MPEKAAPLLDKKSPAISAAVDTNTSQHDGITAAPGSKAPQQASHGPSFVASTTGAKPLGLEGRKEALTNYRSPYTIPRKFPDTAAVLGCIPKHCFEKPLWKSMQYALISIVLSISLPIVCWNYLPRPSMNNPLSLVLWAIYAFWEGAILTGCWVVAHECGHNAFCENKYLQDTIGFILHSSLLVPYFSWQRSHAVHHARTNHMSEGETHVPAEADTSGKTGMLLYQWVGEDAFAVVNLFNHLVIGWPAYLMFGATGSPKRGVTNHFIPLNDGLFPGDWKWKVLLSDVGIIATMICLYFWGKYAGSTQVLTLYFFPYLWTNMWLVLYTWLQHTDIDIPHYDESNWTWLKGAFATVDRPYPEPFDFLHHKIGSTHVAHHLCARIPHYHGREATEAIKKNFPEYYMYDPTPIVPALWRVARTCVATVKEEDLHYYTHPTN